MTQTAAVRWIGTYSPRERMVRLARIVWCRGVVGDGRGYSAKLTVALRPRIWQIERGYESHALTVLGVRVHFARSFGGVYA